MIVVLTHVVNKNFHDLFHEHRQLLIDFEKNKTRFYFINTSSNCFLLDEYQLNSMKVKKMRINIQKKIQSLNEKIQQHSELTYLIND